MEKRIMSIYLGGAVILTAPPMSIHNKLLKLIRVSSNCIFVSFLLRQKRNKKGDPKPTAPRGFGMAHAPKL